MSTLETFRYYRDPDLRLVHLFHDCTGLKMARKYNTVEIIAIRTVEEAAELDKKGTPCLTCFKREQHFCKVKNRRPRPGFKRRPRALGETA